LQCPLTASINDAPDVADSRARMNWTSRAKEASMPLRFWKSGMDEDLKELARRLFTVATAILEDATIAAAAGRSVKLTEKSCQTYARELQLVGHECWATCSA
jgi:hypothetical protein